MIPRHPQQLDPASMALKSSSKIGLKKSSMKSEEPRIVR